MGFARRISARWGIADIVQLTGEARLCETLRKIEALFAENSAAARFRARARGVWLALRRSKSNYVAAEPPGTEDRVQQAVIWGMPNQPPQNGSGREKRRPCATMCRVSPGWVRWHGHSGSACAGSRP